MSKKKDKKCTCGQYTMNHTLHNEHYWDVNRNIDVTLEEDNEDFHDKVFDELLSRIVENITNLLKEKNKAYGNTALNPINVFSKLNAEEAICARLDDKIARIKNKGINDETEDTVTDIIGYLLLLKMAK